MTGRGLLIALAMLLLAAAITGGVDTFFERRATQDVESGN